MYLWISATFPTPRARRVASHFTLFTAQRFTAQPPDSATRPRRRRLEGPRRRRRRRPAWYDRPWSSGEMNAFRLAGDMTHLMSVLVLLLKIHTIKSCAGENRQAANALPTFPRNFLGCCPFGVIDCLTSSRIRCAALFGSLFWFSSRSWGIGGDRMLFCEAESWRCLDGFWGSTSSSGWDTRAGRILAM
jgi:hypothetical protein